MSPVNNRWLTHENDSESSVTFAYRVRLLGSNIVKDELCKLDEGDQVDCNIFEEAVAIVAGAQNNEAPP